MYILSTEELKQIKENHKAFIKNYEQGLKFSIEQKKYNDKYFKKLKLVLRQ